MFGKKKEEPVPVVKEEVKEIIEEKAPEVFVPADKTVIGSGIIMVGNFDTKDPVEINGTVRGNIRSTKSVSISKTGSLVGEAALGSLKLAGKIEGTVLCSAETVIASTGSIKGNLSTASLETEDGSTFEGRLSMLPKKPAPSPAPAAPDATPIE